MIRMNKRSLTILQSLAGIASTSWPRVTKSSIHLQLACFTPINTQSSSSLAFHQMLPIKFYLLLLRLFNAKSPSTLPRLLIHCSKAMPVALWKSLSLITLSTWASVVGSTKTTGSHCIKSFGLHELGCSLGIRQYRQSSSKLSQLLVSPQMAPNPAIRTSSGRWDAPAARPSALRWASGH